MEPVRFVRVLKQDVFGRVELLERGFERRVRRVADGGGSRLRATVARVLLLRERAALEALTGCAGVPVLEREDAWAEAPGLDGEEPDLRGVLVRGWVAGEPLSRTQWLPEDWFERAAERLRAVHARGVCHNDLHKEPNLVVADDGEPWLIDFQLASRHGPGSWLLASRAAEDLRHLEKLRRRYLRAGSQKYAPGMEALDPPRRAWTSLAWRRTVKPLYNLTARRFFAWRDGEERRPSSGPWPRWTPPVGR
jgi:hypothetical protein